MDAWMAKQDPTAFDQLGTPVPIAQASQDPHFRPSLALRLSWPKPQACWLAHLGGSRRGLLGPGRLGPGLSGRGWTGQGLGQRAEGYELQPHRGQPTPLQLHRAQGD